MKKFIKNIIPSSLFYFLRGLKVRAKVLDAYMFDYKRYMKHSASRRYDTQGKLRGLIIKDYHIIEKGLTMPETRLAFGRDKLINLIKLCIQYYSSYPADEQVNHAIAVILEYKKFHEEHQHQLDEVVLKHIDDLKALVDKFNVNITKQFSVTRDEYLQHINSPFKDFSNSRKSVRNYSEEDVPESLIKSALDLAANAPSACNRQTSKAYVFSGKEQVNKVLGAQNGNRGFGHLANKVLVVSAELGVFAKPMERNQAFIDGGIFTMNVLYALHAHGIAACVLNCSTEPKIDKLQHEVTNIPDSEVIIAMISCGFPVDEFKIPISKRTAENYKIN